MHPDTVRVLTELEKLPGYRAQRLAAQHAGIDVEARISRGLAEIETLLQVKGQLFFGKHPSQDRAPYGVYLNYNVHDCCHDVILRIGNADMMAAQGKCFARIIVGEITKERR